MVLTKMYAPAPKYVGAQEAVAVRAVGLCQIIEHAHQRFQQRLQLSGDLLEVGNDENAHHRRKQQQDPRHRVGRDQPGIHRHAAQKGDRVIPHEEPRPS